MHSNNIFDLKTKRHLLWNIKLHETHTARPFYNEFLHNSRSPECKCTHLTSLLKRYWYNLTYFLLPNRRQASCFRWTQRERKGNYKFVKITMMLFLSAIIPPQGAKITILLFSSVSQNNVRTSFSILHNLNSSTAMLLLSVKAWSNQSDTLHIPHC